MSWRILSASDVGKRLWKSFDGFCSLMVDEWLERHVGPPQFLVVAACYLVQVPVFVLAIETKTAFQVVYSALYIFLRFLFSA